MDHWATTITVVLGFVVVLVPAAGYLLWRFRQYGGA